MDPALRNSCLRAPLGRAVWLAKYKELWLFKPILWKVKVPLCWRKPGIWANIVATLLSLLLKPLSLLSSSQINYCTISLSWFLALHFPLTSNLLRCWFVHSRCLFGQSAEAWLSCTSPPSHLCSSVSPLTPQSLCFCTLYGCSMLFSATLSSFCFMTSFVLLCTSGVLRQKGWDRAYLLHSLPGRSFIPGNLFYWSHLSLFSCLILSTYPTAWIAINMNYTTWQFLPWFSLIYLSARL